ncbi:MAG: hypothetical protein HC836_46600 [Richelia sp. RM2_1_2]|nr:hypothetical protein [Richelia sp. RM2_1_2]
MMEFTNVDDRLVSINITKVDSFQELEYSQQDKKITVVSIAGTTYFLRVEYNEFKRQYRLYNGQ